MFGDEDIREAVERERTSVEKLHEQHSHHPWCERSTWSIFRDPAKGFAVLRVSWLAVRVILTLAPSARCHVARQRQVAGNARRTGGPAGTGSQVPNKKSPGAGDWLIPIITRARMTFGCPMLRAKCKHSGGSQPPQPPRYQPRILNQQSTRCLQARAKSHTL